MNFGDLIDQTNTAHRGALVKVRSADGTEHDLVNVEVQLVDLDIGKALGGEAEGQGRLEMTVWLHLTP